MSDGISELTRHRMRHAILQWDKRQERAEVKRGMAPNIYRIGIALGGIEKVEEKVKLGKSLRWAILTSFNDRLLSAVLKGCKMEDFTNEEKWESEREYNRTLDEFNL